MAHETLLLNGRTRSLTHVQIEITAHALIHVIEKCGMADLAPLVRDWRARLEMAEAGLIDVERDPYFSGPGGAERLRTLLPQAQEVIPVEGEAIPTPVLNARIGTRIEAPAGLLPRRVSDEAFAALEALADEAEKGRGQRSVST